MKIRRKKPRRRVEVILRVPVEARHGIEVGDVYDATDGAEAQIHETGPRAGYRKRSKFLGSVWIIAKGSGERVRLQPDEFREVPP